MEAEGLPEWRVASVSQSHHSLAQSSSLPSKSRPGFARFSYLRTRAPAYKALATIDFSGQRLPISGDSMVSRLRELNKAHASFNALGSISSSPLLFLHSAVLRLTDSRPSIYPNNESFLREDSASLGALFLDEVNFGPNCRAN